MTENNWREAFRPEPLDETPAFGLGQLSEGDAITVCFESDGEVIETQFGETMKFDLVVDDVEGLDALEATGQDDNDDPVQITPGERATLLTGSKRFAQALVALELDNLTGVVVRIEKVDGDDDSYNTEYEAEVVEE